MRNRSVVAMTAIVCSIAALSGCSGHAKVRAKTADRAQAQPSRDADGDGVPDSSDRCPGQKEDGRAPDPHDGCPAAPLEAKFTITRKPRVEVTRTEVKISEKILFEFKKASIAAASNQLINDIAQVLKAHPEIELVEVGGHADNVGPDSINLRLTNERAKAVVTALVHNGVDNGRLRPVGYGRFCPLVPNDNEEAREKNRRVEFKIIRMEGKDTGVELGCPAASSKGIPPKR